MPDLGDATSPETRGATLVLVPVGATEQHGPHLPLDTDTVVAVAVAEATGERLGAWVAPALAFGASGEHQGFPGTVSMGTEALHHVVVELVRSLRTWAARVVLVNGNGGNVFALEAAVNQMVAEGHDVAWVPCDPGPGADLHAGRTETSLMLHLRPAAVRLDRAQPGDVRPFAEVWEEMRAGGVAAVSANGVLGDPTGATAAEGADLLDQMVAQVIYRIGPRG